MSRTRPAGSILAAFATALLAVGAMVPTVATAEAAPNVVVVDDDRVQCPQADTDSVQTALDLVRDGGRVRVCPGRYTEQLTIRHPVHLQGQIGAVASLDCLDPAPSALDDVDVTRFAILEPDPDTGDEPTTHVRIAADDVELAGFVVQGLIDTTPQHPTPTTVGCTTRAVAVHRRLRPARECATTWSGSTRSASSSAARGSSRPGSTTTASATTTYAVANQRYHLVDGRIDDNTTFRHRDPSPSRSGGPTPGRATCGSTTTCLATDLRA